MSGRAAGSTARGRRGPGTALLAGLVAVAAGILPAAAATVSLPAAGAPPAGTAPVTLTIDSANGVLGTDIVVTFDPLVVTGLSVAKTTLSNPHTLTTNLATPGVMRISLFGAVPLSGGGAFLTLTFRSAGPAGSSSPLTLASVLLNEGQIPSTTIDGSWCVQGPASEAANLRLEETAAGSPVIRLTWDPVPGAAGYNVYRGAAADLADLGCFLTGGTAATVLDDGAVPPPGSQIVYLVTALTCSDESSLGTDSAGTERSAAVPCP